MWRSACLCKAQTISFIDFVVVKLNEKSTTHPQKIEQMEFELYGLNHRQSSAMCYKEIGLVSVAALQPAPFVGIQRDDALSCCRRPLSFCMPLDE
jgi:hypothetical protein